MKLILMFVGLMGLLGFGQASAQMMTYTESVTASGTLGTSSFTDKTFTLTGTAEASDITTVPPGVLLVSDLTATVDISGLGLATFTDPISTYVRNGTTVAGFVDFTSGTDILDTTNAAFASYNLASSIGPLSGAAIASIGNIYNTTLGKLTLYSVSQDATFEATAAPEPSVFCLEACGVLFVFVVGQLRFKRLT